MFDFEDQCSASRKCYNISFSKSLFNTLVFDCDMWGHSESIVRAIEFKLFTVFMFLMFGTADVSNYSKLRPKFVPSLSPLWSVFSSRNPTNIGPKMGSGGSQQSEKSGQSLVGEVLKSFWSFWSRRWVGLGRPGGPHSLSRRPKGPRS